MFKIEEEERKLEAAIEETEKQNAEVNAELKELELKSTRFKELEERLVFSPHNAWWNHFSYMFHDKIKTSTRFCFIFIFIFFKSECFMCFFV